MSLPVCFLREKCLAVLQNTEPNWSLTLRVIKGSPEKMTCVVDIMEFATGSTALEAPPFLNLWSVAQ
jgi:hypothetical protein